MSHIISSFEDLKALEGLEVGVSDWFQITQEQINQFADVTLDHNGFMSILDEHKKRCQGEQPLHMVT